MSKEAYTIYYFYKTYTSKRRTSFFRLRELRGFTEEVLFVHVYIFNGLQVNEGSSTASLEFIKSLLFRDFDDVLKDLYRYVHIFLLFKLLSIMISKITNDDLQQRIKSCGATPPY